MGKIPFENFNLVDWVDFTQRQHWRSMDMTLDRISEVWDKMGGTTRGFIIVVGGTNGKGSTISMLDAAFTNAGLKTGAYTSPHLVRYNERIKIAGLEASDTEICNAFCAIETARQEIPLTYFEFGTLCALTVLNNHRVEVSLLEVGMGGRLDAVNMVDADISVITSIGIDHEQWLGSDRESIAIEKSGIMRPYKAVVCTEPNPPEAIRSQSSSTESVLYQLGIDFTIQRHHSEIQWQASKPALKAAFSELSITNFPYQGDHQLRNLSAACTVLALASSQLNLTKENMAAGMASARIAARCQIIQLAPLTILDVAHNSDSAKELEEFVNNHPVKGSTLSIFGVLEDKALNPIVRSLVKHVDQWYLTTLDGERGQTAENLSAKMSEFVDCADLSCHTSPRDAYQAAISCSGDDDRIIIFGSFHTVGDILEYLETIAV